MSAFVAFPGWDPSGRAASFSPEILGYLRGTLNFAGLVVTDALIMAGASAAQPRSEEHTSELQSLAYLVCRLLLEKKKKQASNVVSHQEYKKMQILIRTDKCNITTNLCVLLYRTSSPRTRFLSSH